MRIWYIGEWHDFLWLMSVLGVHDHEYHCISDHTIRPSSAKSLQSQQMSMQRLITYTIKTVWCDFIVVPPIYEWYFNKTCPEQCIPLFSRMIDEYIAPNSLVNKRWLVWDSQESFDEISSHVLNLQEKYIPSDRQRTTKPYRSVPVLTWASVPQMKFHMLTYGKNDRMMRKVRKSELRCLKDAAVDTVFFTDWSMLHREKILRHHLNRKRINIVGKKAINAIFSDYTSSKKSSYSVTIHTNDHEWFKKIFLAHKKWRWMLERGKSVEINWKVLSH